MVETKSLNIKDPRTHELARRYADITGLSMTQAVNRALEESISRAAPRKIDLEAFEQNLQALRGEMQASFFEAEDPTAFLYGEDGLPR